MYITSQEGEQRPHLGLLEFTVLSLSPRDLDPLRVLCDDHRCNHTSCSVDNPGTRLRTPSTLPLRTHQRHRDTHCCLSQANVTRARYTGGVQ
jgi:hypothetical protein